MTYHILVVDDEPDVESLLSQQFRREVRRGIYVLSFARNGQEALNQIAEAEKTSLAVDMVLTDINMPVMDGLMLLSKLNDLARSPKAVVVSAYGDMDNIRKAMNQGAFDFITKPIQRQDLNLTIQKTLKAVAKERALLEQLKQAKLQLVQSEKMSALGQMVAGLAHEINNPVNFIYGNLSPARKYAQDLQALVGLYQRSYPNPTEDIQDFIEEVDLDFLNQDLDKTFNSLITGAVRIRDLVLSLRNFSRLDESAQKAVDIHEGIDSTLLILNNRLAATEDRGAIIIEKGYSELPLVECYPSQLNQVFMNILANAIDAISTSQSSLHLNNSSPQSGKIHIATESIAKDQVRITIEDNGFGIEESAIAKLFDPFYTTKPVGEGTGIGLSISYQIVVEKHHGKLYCKSEPSQGARFYIELPVSLEAESAEAQKPTEINSFLKENDLLQSLEGRIGAII